MEAGSDHTHVKSQITDFDEEDYIHTSGYTSQTIYGDLVITGDLTVYGDASDVFIGYSGTTITGLTQIYQNAPEKVTTITYNAGVITEINSTQGDVSKQIIINYDIDGNITSIEKNII